MLITMFYLSCKIKIIKEVVNPINIIDKTTKDIFLLVVHLFSFKLTSIELITMKII